MGKGESCSLLSSARGVVVQQKPFLFSCNSGLHSHGLTHVLFFLQPVEELRETALSILKDVGQKLEGNLSVVGLTGAWVGRAPSCCQPGSNMVYSLSEHLVSLQMSVVKVLES